MRDMNMNTTWLNEDHTRCQWSVDGICECRDGIADDPKCDGTFEDMWWCNYVDSPYDDE